MRLGGCKKESPGWGVRGFPYSDSARMRGVVRIGIAEFYRYKRARGAEVPKCAGETGSALPLAGATASCPPER
jgi:hypothetical protein